MKKIIVILTLASFTLNQAKLIKDSLYLPKEILNYRALEEECDVCGCAAGSGSSGFESLLDPQFIGIKYFGQHYRAKENMFVNDLTQDQYFNTFSIWGKIPITKKISLYGSLPYHFNEKKTLNGDISISGVGDANVMGIYQILNSQNTYHQLNGGVGVKIPLGKFDEKGVSGVNPSFQLGTGSWDYQFVLNYQFQKNLFALMLNTDYTIKTDNKKHYQFGNQWNYAATGFHRIWRNENSVFSGKIGLQGEVFTSNKQFSEKLPETSGNAFYGKVGFEASYKKWSLGTELMLPIHSDLASGDIEGKYRIGIFLNFGL